MKKLKEVPEIVNGETNTCSLHTVLSQSFKKIFILGQCESSLLCGLFSSCGGCSCCRERALECEGLSNCSTWALEHRLNNCGTWA